MIQDCDFTSKRCNFTKFVFLYQNVFDFWEKTLENILFFGKKNILAQKEAILQQYIVNFAMKYFF